jgi:hypothetical protein
MASKGSAYIEINIDPATLPVIGESLAVHMIDGHNADMMDEIRVNGRSDKKRWFLLDHEKGKFIAEIAHASGGGRVSADGVGNYCNLSIEYEFHYLVKG